MVSLSRFLFLGHAEDGRPWKAGMLMVAPAVEGIDLFKIAGRSISEWVPSLKTGTASPVTRLSGLVLSAFIE